MIYTILKIIKLYPEKGQSWKVCNGRETIIQSDPFLFYVIKYQEPIQLNLRINIELILGIYLCLALLTKQKFATIMKRLITQVVALFILFNIATPTAYSQFGKGIKYATKDTSFTVKFNFRFQNLYVATYDEASEDWSSQFLVRRSRLKFSGFAFNPKITYKAEMGLSNRDISVSSEDGNGRGASRLILDAVIKWQFADNWSLWAGQTKLPGNRERVISSANLQFVDRSNLNSKLNIDRDAGLQLRGKFKAGKMVILPTLAVSQGEGRNITSNNFGGYSYTGRVDFLPMGKFKKKGDYDSSDLHRESTPKLAFGVAFEYNDGAVRQGGQVGKFVRDSTGVYAENSLSTFFADAIFKYNGISVMSEYAIKTADKEIGGTDRNFNTGSAFNIQMGYLFKNNVELAARYTTLRADDNGFSGLSDTDEITLGISKYVVGHSLKVQADISRIYAPDIDDGAIRFRTQVEMQF